MTDDLTPDDAAGPPPAPPTGAVPPPPAPVPPAQQPPPPPAAQQPPPPGDVPPAPAMVPPAPAAPAPGYAPAPAPVAKRGMGGRIAAAVVGVAVIGGGLTYAVTQAGDGGASSPEAAAEEFFDALSNEDLLGLLDVLPDGERRAFQEPIESMAEELKRLGVLDDGLDLSSVSGIDLGFDDVEFTSEELGDGIASVQVTAGTLSIDIDPDEVPIGARLADLIEDLSGTPLELDPVSESDDFDPRNDEFELVAIEDDGTWRVSLLYSIAEMLRADAGAPLPDFGNGVTPNGQDSPEAAVEALVRAAAEDLDFESVIALLPPDEMGVLYDYAPLFLGDLDGLTADLDQFFELSINDIGFESERRGDTATVAVTTFDVVATFEGEEVAFAFDGECVVVEGPDFSEEQCPDDAQFDLFDDLDLPINMEVDDLAGITAVEVDGDWYVSPTRTVLDTVVAGLGALDDDALERLPELFEAFMFMADDFSVDMGMGEGLGGIVGGDDDIGGDDDDTTTTTLGEPSRAALVQMLIDDQDFTQEDAECTADEIYAADFSDEVLATLQTGEIPSSARMQISDIVTFCVE